MSLFDFFKGPDAETLARREAAEMRQQEIIAAIRSSRVPASIRQRLNASRDGNAPWIATLTPAELLIVRSHGVRPIAAISASCWLHYGWSWTNGHREGWQAALRRLREEAKAAGANAVLDVKMRTIPVDAGHSMDFTLIGTAVYIEDLPARHEPIVATLPALEFVKLLDMGIVPTGIAIGAHYRWLTDWAGATANLYWNGNTEVSTLSNLWESVRGEALVQLQRDARPQGKGCLAHIHFSQMFEGEQNEKKAYLARYIVIATVIDQSGSNEITQDFHMCVDMRSGQSPLTGTTRHHQSYESNEREGAI